MENKRKPGAEPLRGRPAKGKEKLDHSINVKLTEADLGKVRAKAEKLGMKATQYAREMTLNGGVKSRFTLEELDLMRKLSGEANNLNQLAKRANQAGFTRVGNEILVVLEWIKALFDDR